MQEAAARSLRRVWERLRPLAKNRTLRYGVPMMLLIIGGSFGLREFTQIRYDAQKLHSKLIKYFGGNRIHLVPVYVVTLRAVPWCYTYSERLCPFCWYWSEQMDPALEERIRKNKISLESEYEKLKNSDFDDWKNIRGPRPWEDSKSFQEQQQQVLHSKPS
ncbi:cytochrome c oxidase assembly protein COX16 homolog, mitochondrial isoform X1 [Dermochelys coriacea]|uniref:cytochrome c oxidase assembly protein COX16 homolog, mitochondrial isoform X1 n=1 Tax=Dermochelys coriacea TaxID=27794 RepID=UPI001CA997C1|nr:cytochrome c oxidase assembly protein COX16 homolog, mitochondrial isoform X1 [Dermochelys coriacea]